MPFYDRYPPPFTVIFLPSRETIPGGKASYNEDRSETQCNSGGIAVTPAEQITAWADHLRNISAMGLHFARSIYDEHNYRAVQDIAMAMLALATNSPMEAMEPLRAPIFSHPTPFAAGDAAVIDPDDNHILLIRRADSGEWAMPGGALDVGETPAQGVAREVLEETGILCEPTRLAGVFDSRLCGTVSRHHLYHFVFICRPLNRGAAVTALTPGEVLETAWYGADALPTDLYPGHAIRIAEAFRVWHGQADTFFDD